MHVVAVTSGASVGSRSGANVMRTFHAMETPNRDEEENSYVLGR